jgi:hypothetical protein
MGPIWFRRERKQIISWMLLKSESYLYIYNEQFCVVVCFENIPFLTSYWLLIVPEFIVFSTDPSGDSKNNTFK